jgi:hypothetical protein
MVASYQGRHGGTNPGRQTTRGRGSVKRRPLQTAEGPGEVDRATPGPRVPRTQEANPS